MTRPTFDGDPNLALQADALRERFVAAWRQGDSPRIEEFLDELHSADARYVSLRELILVELELKRESGKRSTREDYLTRFPDEAAVVEEAFAKETAAEAATTATWSIGAGPETTGVAGTGAPRGGDGIVVCSPIQVEYWSGQVDRQTESSQAILQRISRTLPGRIADQVAR